MLCPPAISRAAVEIASEIEARAIITATMSGTTARMVARHRPLVPIVAVTPNLATLVRLSPVWGVMPVQVPNGAGVSEPQWSPDGSAVAFLVHQDDATYVYTANPENGRSRQVTRTPVLATFGAASRVGLEIERLDDGRVVVLVPSSPNPWSGPVHIMAPDDVQRLDLPVTAYMQTIERFGQGTNELLRTQKGT